MEIWDLYTEDRTKTGETHVRGNPIPKNRYHLVVQVWIKNSENKYLISRRSKTKSTFPLKYEATAGSALKGEKSIEAAIRETKEEVGINLDPSAGKLVFSEIRKEIDGMIFNDINDVWLFNYDGEVDLKNATTDEVESVKWMTVDEIYELYRSGVTVSNRTETFDKIVSLRNKNL